MGLVDPALDLVIYEEEHTTSQICFIFNPISVGCWGTDSMASSSKVCVSTTTLSWVLMLRVGERMPFGFSVVYSPGSGLLPSDLHSCQRWMGCLCIIKQSHFSYFCNLILSEEPSSAFCLDWDLSKDRLLPGSERVFHSPVFNTSKTRQIGLF